MGIKMQMRVVILLALSVAATALPFEESLVEIHAEAQAEVNSLLAAGKSDKACKSLAKADIKQVEDAVKKQNKFLKALPTGKECANEGQAWVKAAEKALDKAKKDLKHANAKKEQEFRKPLEYAVTFGAVKDDACVVHPSDSTFKKAKKDYKKAKGAKGQAEKNLKNAKDQAKKDVHACLCKVQKGHNDAWRIAIEHNDANQKAFAKGKHDLRPGGHIAQQMP